MGFRPLAGLRVVDVTTSIAGPYCTEILGALGAEVIKVEPPVGGDEARAWGPPFFEGTSTMFLSANANKRSVAVELRRGRQIVLDLAARSDVFVQSLRPGLADERGLGPDDLRARDERLVYCSIGGFGAAGPLAGRPGYDVLAQAAAGMISVTGESTGGGVRVGTSVIDQSTGLWAAFSILAALTEREQTGRGATIDVSLYETAVSMMGYHLSGFAATGELPGRHGTGFPSIAPYQAFPTSDGEILIAAGNDRAFASLCSVLDVPGLTEDPRYATNAARVEHREALAALLEPLIAARTRDDWLEQFAAANIPAAPIQDVAEVAAHPQTAALGLLQTLGGLPVAGLPMSVDGARVTHASAAPALGRDTEDVLRETGYSDEAILELAASGIVTTS